MFLYDKFIERKHKKLEMLYDKEIRENCENYRLIMMDCMKRLDKDIECMYNINNFVKCIKEFDNDFKFKHNIK